MWYVLVGHYEGHNFAHCELYRPNQEIELQKQANFWTNHVGYTTVKVLQFGSKEEAYAKIDKIEKGW